VCLVGVWQLYAAKQRALPNTDQAHDKHQ